MTLNQKYYFYIYFLKLDITIKNSDTTKHFCKAHFGVVTKHYPIFFSSSNTLNQIIILIKVNIT
jgi:hypothetical protein